MTESNTPNPAEPAAPLTPLTPVATTAPEPGHAAPPPEGVAFHERLVVGRGRSTATRVGVITGSALLVLVGAVAAMGASPSPSSDPASGIGADPSAGASAAAPAASGAPTTKGDHAGPLGGFGKGFRGGFPGVGIGFHDITISAIDGSSLSLETEDGWTRTITVTETTTITKGGATIALGDLAVGDEIRFRQERASDGTYSVTAIVVVLPTVVGEITAIDGSTITVTQPGGTTATIHVDSDTTYRTADGAGSLSDLQVGAVIVAEGTQRADGSLDADAIGSGFKDGRGRHGIPGLGPDKAPAASPAPSSGAS
jgi:uncharacterized protein DUF5666